MMRHRPGRRSFLAAGSTALLSLLSGACGLLPQPPRSVPTLYQTPVLPPTPTPTAPPPLVNTLQPPSDLTLWLPPEFTPSGTSAAAQLLRARLEEFGKVNTIQVKSRVKALAGQTSLLASLTATAAAAPRAMPGVVALARPDLETAALKGLLIPLDGISTTINDTDWYDYAHQLALVQGASFGLPFACEALVIIYRPSQWNTPPASWEAILRLNQPLAFPAASQQALTTISLYQAAGGEIENAQRQPVLQGEALTSVLQLMRQGAERGVFPTWLSQYDSDGQVFQIYQEGRVNAAITWSSFTLSSLPADSAVFPLPDLAGKPTSLAGGWIWAITDPIPERRALSVKLAEWLVDAKFLAQWCEVAGCLPARPSSLAAWHDQGKKATFGPVAQVAHARPSNDLLASLGPLLRDATLKVIRMEADPLSAAAAATDHLSTPVAP